jgi:hypothetical protein
VQFETRLVERGTVPFCRAKWGQSPAAASCFLRSTRRKARARSHRKKLELGAECGNVDAGRAAPRKLYLVHSSSLVSPKGQDAKKCNHPDTKVTKLRNAESIIVALCQLADRAPQSLMCSAWFLINCFMALLRWRLSPCTSTI